MKEKVKNEKMSKVTCLTVEKTNPLDMLGTLTVLVDKPKKMAAKEINSFVDELSPVKVNNVYGHLTRHERRNEKSLLPFQAISYFVGSVIYIDQQFENKHSEREYAAECAETLIHRYNCLLPILDKMPDEHAEIAQLMLSPLSDFMFMRILGDALGEYDKLIKTVFRADFIKNKITRHHLRKYLTENNGKTFDADYLQTIVNDMEG